MEDKPAEIGSVEQLGNISSTLQPTSGTPNDASPAQIHSHTSSQQQRELHHTKNQNRSDSQMQDAEANKKDRKQEDNSTRDKSIVTKQTLET